MEILFGAMSVVLGGIITLVVSHVYYKRATADLLAETTRLRETADAMNQGVTELIERTRAVEAHVAAGTPDDSSPYGPYGPPGARHTP